MKKIIVSIAAVAMTMALAPAASAQDASANMDVYAFVSTECSVEAPNSLDFGDYSPFDNGSPFSETNITVYCTKGTDVKVGLSSAALKMTGQFRGEPDTLSYELCSTWAALGCDHPWDDNTNQVEIASTAGTPGDTLTVYGRVPANQNVHNDLYSDTIAVNVWIQ